MKWIKGVSCNAIRFNGPYNNLVFEMKARGDQLWVAPGGYSSTWAKNWIKDGVYYYTDDVWHNINSSNTDAFDTITDIVTIAIDPINNSKVYVGSYHDGILEFEDFELKKIYNDAANAVLSYRLTCSTSAICCHAHGACSTAHRIGRYRL